MLVRTFVFIVTPLLMMSLLLGCTGQIISPGTSQPVAPAGSSGFACPTIPSTIGTCSAGRLLRTSLTCGGDGKMNVALSGIPGGGTRFDIQFQNNTTFRGTVITPDPACWINDGAVMTIFFGATYSGDQGTEPVGDGTTRACITQSNVVYSQFRFGDPVFSPWEGSVKNELHLAIDNAAINEVFIPTGGARVPGRCARWRLLP
jgi:hypothetical protein